LSAVPCDTSHYPEWPDLLVQAAAIVESYDSLVTLRQLFYRFVAGEDIDRDFIARTDCWTEVRRVALTAAQVAQYALPPQPGKDTDSRAAAFVARHGRLVQVELDALPPDVLRGLYQEAIDTFWIDDAYQQTLVREARERRSLTPKKK
jgi:hypothetical protein